MIKSECKNLNNHHTIHSEKSVKMNISRLKNDLEAMASSHANFLKQNNKVNTANIPLSNDDVEKFRQQLLSLPRDAYFGNIDPDSLWKGVLDLIKSSETTFNSGEHNLYVPGDTDRNNSQSRCEQGNSDQTQIVPAVYDILSKIFFSTDQPERQRHFHDLTDFYYASLKQRLLQYDSDVSSSLSKTEYQNQIKRLTPYAKLEALRRHCADMVVKPRHPQLKAAILEMHECLLSSQDLLREDCYKIVNNYLSSNNYEFKTFEINRLEERKGFLGDYLKLKIYVGFNNEDKVLHSFVKAMPTTSETIRDMALKCFKKEEFYYESFLPLLKRLGCGDITNFAPKCVFVRTNDIIVLEDLVVQGCANKDMMSISGEYEWVSLAVKKLARLHACSIIYEEKSSEETGRAVRCDEDFGEYLGEQLYIDRDNYVSMLNCCFRTVNYFLDKFPDIPKRMTLNEFKRRMNQSIDKLYEDVKKSNTFRNVINHGDMYCNNLLFKTNERNEPIDCFIVDFQLTRYCPPTKDLVFLLYINTDRKMREKYSAQLLDEYFMELKKILSSYGIDIDRVFTYRAFLDSCDYMKLSTLCETLIYIQMQTFPKDKFKLLQENEEKFNYFMNVDRSAAFDEVDDNCILWAKMRENIEEMYEILDRDSEFNR